MSDALLRICRRRSSFEPENLEQVYKVEFCIGGDESRPDLQLSLYSVRDESPTIVRVYAEHYASSGLEPPIKPRGLVNVCGLEPMEPIKVPPPAAVFRLLRESHREIHFPDSGGLSGFVAKLIGDLAGRDRQVSRDQAHDYVLSRHREADPEWKGILATPKWTSAIQKWAKARSKP